MQEVFTLLDTLRDALASEAGVGAAIVGRLVRTEQPRFPLDEFTLHVGREFAKTHPAVLTHLGGLGTSELVELVDVDKELTVRLLPVYTILSHDVAFNQILRSGLDDVGVGYVTVGNGTGIHCDTLVVDPSQVHFWKGHTPERVSRIVGALMGTGKGFDLCLSVPYDCQPFSLPVRVEESFIGQTPLGPHYCVSHLLPEAPLHRRTDVRPPPAVPNLYTAGYRARGAMDCITVVHRCTRIGDSIRMLPIKEHMMTITHMLNEMYAKKCEHVAEQRKGMKRGRDDH